MGRRERKESGIPGNNRREKDLPSLAPNLGGSEERGDPPSPRKARTPSKWPAEDKGKSPACPGLNHSS